MNKRAFGELESEILFILKSGERKTVKDVHKALGGGDNYNTVMTVMSRLSEKKKLGRERIGLQYEYWLLESKESFTFFDKIKLKFSGFKTSALVSHLIETADDISDDELKEMENIVKKLRDSRK